MTLDEADPYVEARARQILFREAVLAFMGAHGEDAGDPEQTAYCAACRAAGPADCSQCDKTTIGAI